MSPPGNNDNSNDDKILGNRALSKFDVLVIGSGAGGGSLAGMLCRLGQKVLVLEAGPNRFRYLDDPTRQPSPRVSNDELKLAVRNFITPDPLVEPRTFRKNDQGAARSLVGDVNGLPKHVGGGAVHADLKMPRYAPDDFHLGTLLGDVAGASFADWPVDYDMLEPFYLYMERALGVQGLAGANPFEGKRSAPFPMPPGNPMYVALRAAEGATKIGLQPFPYPTAVNSRPYDGRPACVDCGYCSGFGCPSNAKGSTAVTTLRAALLSGNCLLLSETRAVRLLLDGARASVTGVECIGPDGKRVTYSADCYVLAASPIEDARLCLLSDPGGPGVGNSSGLVGRNLMFHFQTNAIGLFEERLHGHRGRTVTHGFADFRGVPGDPARPLGGIVELSGSEFPIGEAAIYAQIIKLTGKFDGAMFKRLLRQGAFRDHVMAMTMQAEDAPQTTNRVDLDPDVRDLDGLPAPRITYDHHAFELHARDVYGPRMLDMLGAAGARWAAVAPIDDPSVSAHIMGTLRFGSDAKKSVCDANGRFHDLANLYAADGALFPTSAGWNPTMTITTLAARVAAAMVYPDAPERALPPP